MTMSTEDRISQLEYRVRALIIIASIAAISSCVMMFDLILVMVAVAR